MRVAGAVSCALDARLRRIAESLGYYYADTYVRVLNSRFPSSLAAAVPCASERLMLENVRMAKLTGIGGGFTYTPYAKPFTGQLLVHKHIHPRQTSIFEANTRQSTDTDIERTPLARCRANISRLSPQTPPVSNSSSFSPYLCKNDVPTAGFLILIRDFNHCGCGARWMRIRDRSVGEPVQIERGRCRPGKGGCRPMCARAP
jgi:hypothetical protein